MSEDSTPQGSWNSVDVVSAVNVADLAAAKQVVLDYYADFDSAEASDLAAVIGQHTTADYHWRGMRPFYEIDSAAAVAEQFWQPFRQSFSPVQRRPDVFLAGANVIDDGESVWVCQMGHLLGLFDAPWLDIPPTGRMCFFRFAEFHRVTDGHIAETALFFDVISIMTQAGHNPMPPQTGASHIHPGPLTHDGVMVDLDNMADPANSAVTMQLVHDMGADLNESNRIANETGDNRVPPELLAKTWHDDMIWSGPAGIGASYTIERYQQQHQYPFRMGLEGKTFNGHVARFAEGNYACFFGWPNLTNTATGGFMGMPASSPADMRVVDVYRRDGDKLAENWVFIDVAHWLSQQGLDVLERMRQLNGEKR